MSDTPETNKAERMAWSQEYMVPTDFARQLERERNELKSIIEQRLVAGATIHQNANDLMRRNERLESERDELFGVIKSLKKNTKEDADRIDKLEQALSYGSGGETLLTKFLNAVKERNELLEMIK